jgi:predicted transposase/invertase (TIGR01784 family)
MPDMKTKTNRKFKDSVFTLLFSEKSNLLELYNAIGNTNYGKDTDIRITTLDDALFMEQINDISFVIEGKLVVLIEHQSTINPNMPIRMLLYIARTYEKIVDKSGLYSTKRMSIPKPEFIVLYNGIEECPDKQVLRLSDMFSEPLVEEIANLELYVNIYNINEGRNEELAKRSEKLKGYEIFVSLVREHLKSMGRDSAIRSAVSECIRGDVLKDFFSEHGSEVENMLLSEWNLDDALAVRYEEGIDSGIDIGVTRTAKNMLEDGLDPVRVARITKLSEKQIMELRQA